MGAHLGAHSRKLGAHARKAGATGGTSGIEFHPQHHAAHSQAKRGTPSPQNLRAQKFRGPVGFRSVCLRLLTRPLPSVTEPQRCHTDARKGAQTFTPSPFFSSPPCVFAWEQWEQWEHRINRGFQRSHSILSSGNSGNKSRGNGRFLHIFGHQSPRSGQNSEPRTFNTAETPMHLLVHICNFQREGDSRPRPHRAARMASAWHTHKGPCTRMNARAWPGGGVTRPTRPRRTAPGVCDSSVRAPGRAGAA